MNYLNFALCCLIVLFSFGEQLALANESKNNGGSYSDSFVSNELKLHLEVIEKSGSELRIVSDGRFLKLGSPDKSFCLKPGEKLENKDRHSSIVLTFLNVDDKAAKFRYEFRVDQRSIGKDFSSYSGELVVALKPKNDK